jgi:Ca-activated chloride channel family protein
LTVERHEDGVTRVETAVNRPYVPPVGTTVFTTVDIHPGERTGPVERHLVLCVDTSGSMTGEKIMRTREGIEWVFGLLEPDDCVAVVGFDAEPELLLEPAQWGNVDAETVEECVRSIKPGGGTNTFEALGHAQEALAAMDQAGGDDQPVRQILLVSDGKDERHDLAAFEELAAGIDDAGIRIYAGGIGDSYDEDTIRTLGRGARGEWAHLEEPGDIEAFFGDAVERAGTVVAPDARLTFDLATGVELDEVYRAEPQAQAAGVDREAGTVTVGLPDLAAGERQCVVAKVHAPPREAGTDATLAEVTVTADGADASDAIAVEYTEAKAKLATNEAAIQLAHEDAIHRTELGRGDLQAATKRLERMTTISSEDAAEVRAALRRTQRVREGGRAARNRATRVDTGRTIG